MVRAEVRTTVKRPIEQIFAVMSDASKNARWASGISETTKTSDGPITLDDPFTSPDLAQLLGVAPPAA